MDERLKDNTFESLGFSENHYTMKAHRDLIVTKGKGFTKEKNKVSPSIPFLQPQPREANYTQHKIAFDPRRIFPTAAHLFPTKEQCFFYFETDICSRKNGGLIREEPLISPQTRLSSRTKGVIF